MCRDLRNLHAIVIQHQRRIIDDDGGYDGNMAQPGCCVISRIAHALRLPCLQDASPFPIRLMTMMIIGAAGRSGHEPQCLRRAAFEPSRLLSSDASQRPNLHHMCPMVWA